MGLHKFYRKVQFEPGLLGVFLNPFYFIRKPLFSKIKKYSEHLEGKILDFGCGSKPYEKLFKKAVCYIGIDIHNPGHDHRKEYVNLFYDGRKIPFEDQYFDSVFCSEVFEHVFNIDEILGEINRVLKINGSFLITVPFAWDEHEEPYDYGRYTSFGIRFLLEKHYFEVIYQEKTGHYFEVMAQLFIHYIRHIVYTRNKYLNVFLNLIFIAPFTLLFSIINIFIPRINSLFFNNVLLVRKRKNECSIS